MIVFPGFLGSVASKQIGNFSLTESFEYSGGWTGTLPPPQIPNFDSPQFSLTESFESSWDGT